MTVLELRDVHRTHGVGAAAVHALRGVSLRVRPGELVAVMGPSGSGKSSLLNLAGGLDRPTGGEVRVEGNLLAAMSRRELARLRRRSVGYVFQDLNLIPGLTAAENVALPLELDGTGVRAARRAAMTALTEVGLDAVAQRFPDDMSGGQQQRVAIARALIGERRLVLADEPTGALDSRSTADVLEIFDELHAAGRTVVVITHEVEVADRAGRVVRLADGRVLEDRPAGARAGEAAA
jgi:putative ABC transport system ATP-binding protein